MGALIINNENLAQYVHYGQIIEPGQKNNLIPCAK